MKENLKDFNLTETLSGKQVLISKKVALDKIIEEYTSNPTNSSTDNSNLSSGLPSNSAITAVSEKLGIAVGERDFKYGHVRVILPKKMTKSEYDKFNTLIKGLVDIVEE